MATDQVNPPKGFVLDNPPPSGFVLDSDLPVTDEQLLGPVEDPTGLPQQVSAGVRLGREIQRRVQPNLREQIGSMAGGTAGSIALPAAVAGALAEPTPFGELGVAGLAAIGAFGGGAIGEAAQATVDPFKDLGLVPALKAGGREAASELIGRGVFGIGRKSLSPIFKKPTPEMVQIGKEFLESGGELLPSQADSRIAGQLAETIGRSGFSEKKLFRDFEKLQEFRAVEHVQGLVDDLLGPRVSKTELGEAFYDQLARSVGKKSGLVKGRKLIQLDEAVNPLYAKFDELATAQAIDPVSGVTTQTLLGRPARGASGVAPSTKKIKEFAAKKLAENKRTNGVLFRGNAPVKGLFEDIVGMPDNLTITEMRNLRSTWLRQVNQFSKDLNPFEADISRLSNLADDAIFKLELNPNLTPQARETLKQANQIYRTGKETIERLYPRQLAAKLADSPEDVLKMFVPEPGKRSEGALKRIRELKKSLSFDFKGNPDPEGRVLFNQLGQTWLGSVIDEATEQGILKEAPINRILQRMGKPALKELVGEDGIQVLNKTKALGNLLNQKAGSAGLIIRGGQAAGAAMMWQGAKNDDYVTVTTGGMLLMGPRTAARLVTSKKGFNLLTSGIKAKAGSKAIGPIAVRAIRLLQDQDRKEQQVFNRAQRRRDAIEREKQRSGQPIAPGVL